MEVMKALNLGPCRFDEGTDMVQTLPDARVLSFASEYFLSFSTPCGLVTITGLLGKWRIRKLQWVAQGHTTAKCQI